jgi:hypothetical protein
MRESSGLPNVSRSPLLPVIQCDGDLDGVGDGERIDRRLLAPSILENLSGHAVQASGQFLASAFRKHGGVAVS